MPIFSAAAIERATSDLGSAIDGADVIMVVTGGSSQAVVARSLAPLLRDGQVILLIPGNAGGSRSFAELWTMPAAKPMSMSPKWLAARADANTSDRQEAVAADRDLPGKPHRSSVSTLVGIVSASGCCAEYSGHGLY
jgi:hypothetical protein